MRIVNCEGEDWMLLGFMNGVAEVYVMKPNAQWRQGEKNNNLEKFFGKTFLGTINYLLSFLFNYFYFLKNILIKKMFFFFFFIYQTNKKDLHLSKVKKYFFKKKIEKKYISVICLYFLKKA